MQKYQRNFITATFNNMLNISRSVNLRIYWGYAVGFVISMLLVYGLYGAHSQGLRIDRISQPQFADRIIINGDKFQFNKLQLHSNMHIFDGKKEENRPRKGDKNMCVPMKIDLEKDFATICIHDPEGDRYVSWSLETYGYWEFEQVKLVMDHLKALPGMILMDIGCNVGVYTVAAAHIGARVISIDANKENHRVLAHSVEIGKFDQQVTQVWNAMSDIHGIINMTIVPVNVGGSYVVGPEKKTMPKFDGQYNQQAYTITFEDLIPLVVGVPVFIKMDIEGNELKAFRGGNLFFEQVDVRYILMEWMVFNDKHPTSENVIAILSPLGFKPYSPFDNSALKFERASIDWPNEVLWVKQ